MVGFEIENGSIGFIIKRVKEMQRQKLLTLPFWTRVNLVPPRPFGGS